MSGDQSRKRRISLKTQGHTDIVIDYIDVNTISIHLQIKKKKLCPGITNNHIRKGI